MVTALNSYNCVLMAPLKWLTGRNDIQRAVRR